MQARRNKVLQYLAEGLTQREIAAKIGVSESSISRDVKAIEQDVAKEYANWVPHLLKEKQRVVEGYRLIIKDLWEIAKATKDTTDKLKAIIVLMQAYEKSLDLSINKPYNGPHFKFNKWINEQAKQQEIEEIQRRLSQRVNVPDLAGPSSWIEALERPPAAVELAQATMPELEEPIPIIEESKEYVEAEPVTTEIKQAEFEAEQYEPIQPIQAIPQVWAALDAKPSPPPSPIPPLERPRQGLRFEVNGQEVETS